MAHDVFISHSAKNKITADAVCARLESEGIRCWIAPRDVTPGMEWGECIIEAIEQARIMVLIFTADANASPQIRREVERAVNRGVAILPLRVEDVLPGKALEYFIGSVHWLDALTPPLEAHLKNLAGTIKMLLARMQQREEPQPVELSTPTEPAQRSPEAISRKVVSRISGDEKPFEIGEAARRRPPQESGTRRPGEWSAAEGAVARTPSWKIPAWAWGSGIVALILVAIFVAVRPVSHPASPAPPPQGAKVPAAPPSETLPNPPSQTPIPQHKQASNGPTWTDPATGLTWTRKDSASDVTWQLAVNFCRNLSVDGYSGWRLPTIDQLAGIYDPAQQTTIQKGTVHIKGGIDLTNLWVWSSSSGNASGEAWYFDFSVGRRYSFRQNFGDGGRALCVRRL